MVTDMATVTPNGDEYGSGNVVTVMDMATGTPQWRRIWQRKRRNGDGHGNGYGTGNGNDDGERKRDTVKRKRQQQRKNGDEG